MFVVVADGEEIIVALCSFSPRSSNKVFFVVDAVLCTDFDFFCHHGLVT